ncbi:MAG TPA: DEAD/DEAH box helicase [Candidatus Saccharimonadales bacterium]|nr:DEAD/DEAH box helicase [Candidatus Saccharimonadales bacterium]
MPYQQRRTFRPGRGASQRSFHSKPARRGGNTKQYINPAKFVQAARQVEVEEYVPTNSFSDFAMHDLLRTNLVTKGFNAPSPIQDQAIPHGLEGKDLVGIANTGTGKTLAFAIPLLDRLLNDKQSRALIMAPTRELAQQIEDECRWLAKTSGLYGALLIGGTPMGPQLRDLRSNPQIVIGTPGRIKDHMERGTLNVSKFNMVVLDEVDRMLDMGFINDMRTILSQLASDRQSFFFSATLDSKVKTLVDSFVHEPVTVSVKTGDTSANVEQNVVTYVSKESKLEKLHDLLIQEGVSKALVFDETQRSVERLSNELLSRGFKVDAIHGGKSQGARQKALHRFKRSEIDILVATDVAARGIDVADITHVINYTTPQTYEDYVHRVGRAGRAGRPGNALTFIEKY